MKIEVTYDNFNCIVYDSLKDAKDDILEWLTKGVFPDRVVEVDDHGEEQDGAKVYGCTWDVTLTVLIGEEEKDQ